MLKSNESKCVCQFYVDTISFIHFTHFGRLVEHFERPAAEQWALVELSVEWLVVPSVEGLVGLLVAFGLATFASSSDSFGVKVAPDTSVAVTVVPLNTSLLPHKMVHSVLRVASWWQLRFVWNFDRKRMNSAKWVFEKNNYSVNRFSRLKCFARWKSIITLKITHLFAQMIWHNYTKLDAATITVWKIKCSHLNGVTRAVCETKREPIYRSLFSQL